MDGAELLSRELFKDHRGVIQAAEEAGLAPSPIAGGSGLLFPGSAQEPLLIYYPGEWETPAHLVELARGMAAEGLRLALWLGVDGGQGLAPDGWLERALEFAGEAIQARGAGEDGDKVVFMGCSVGCSAALSAAVALEERTLCLILESAFVDTWAYLRARGLLHGEAEPPEDPFSNREKMRGFRPAVLFLQCQRDRAVPPSALEWLVSESRSKATQFQICPGTDREDLRECAGPLYYQMIHGFINLRLGRRPRRIGSWRERRRSSSPGT